MSGSTDPMYTNAEVIQIATDILKDNIRKNTPHHFLDDCTYFEIDNLQYYNDHGEPFSFLDFIDAHVPGSRKVINQSLVKILARHQRYPIFADSRRVSYQEILIRLATYGDYQSAQTLIMAVKPDDLAAMIHTEYNDPDSRAIWYETDNTEEGYVLNRMALFSNAIAYAQHYMPENIIQLVNTLKDNPTTVDLDTFAVALAAWCGMAVSSMPASKMMRPSTWHNRRPACLLVILQIDEGVFVKVWDTLLKSRPRDWSSNTILPDGKEVLEYRDRLRVGDKCPTSIPYFVSDWSKATVWHFTNTGLSPHYKQM